MYVVPLKKIICMVIIVFLLIIVNHSLDYLIKDLTQQDIMYIFLSLLD